MTATAEAKKTDPDVPVSPDGEASGSSGEKSDLTELEIMLPEGGRFEVEGMKGTVNRLKSREFLLLMRVITNGLGQGFSQIRLQTEDEEEMKAQLLTMVMMAVPNAIEEFGAFLLAVCEPVDRGEVSEFRQAMVNPDPDVLLDLLGILIEQEQDDLRELVGKAQAWLVRIQKTVTVTG